MTKLYSLLVVLMATSMCYSAQEGGKLPEDFKFQQCDQDDLECLEKRVSFLKQWRAYEQSKDESPVSRRSGNYLPYQELQPTKVNILIPDDMQSRIEYRDNNNIDVIVTHKSSK